MNTYVIYVCLCASICVSMSVSVCFCARTYQHEVQLVRLYFPVYEKLSQRNPSFALFITIEQLLHYVTS
jgi:hypothetical protein